MTTVHRHVTGPPAVDAMPRPGRRTAAGGVRRGDTVRRFAGAPGTDLHSSLDASPTV